MDPHTTVSTIAGPLGDMGAGFYFSPQSLARAEAVGLDVVALYGAGRAADLDPQTADASFYFFKPGMIGAIVERGRAGGNPKAVIEAHHAAADDYAEAHFSTVDPATLTAFADAVSALTQTVPVGSWPLFDGYRAAPGSATPAAKAYRAVILLRELRGGVHTDAVKAQGLETAAACQLDRPGMDYFRMHGFSEEDLVEPTAELTAKKAAAEETTNARMAELYAALSPAQCQAIVDGTKALAAALV